MKWTWIEKASWHTLNWVNTWRHSFIFLFLFLSTFNSVFKHATWDIWISSLRGSKSKKSLKYFVKKLGDFKMCKCLDKIGRMKGY